MILPINIVFSWLNLLLNIIIICLEVYCFRQWYIDADYANRYLIGGAILLFLQFLGQFLIIPFLGNNSGSKPKIEQLSKTQVEMFCHEDGTNSHLDILGEGEPTIIGIHGWSTNNDDWSYIAPHIDKQHKLILWDLPGLGKSDRPKDYSLENYATYLKQIIDSRPGPVILMGHSIGGMIILTFCKLFPDYLNSKVSKLILVHTTYTNPVHTSLFSKILSTLQKPILEPLLHLQIIFAPLFQLNNYLSYANGSAQIGIFITGFAGTQSSSQLDLATRFMVGAPVDVVSKGMLAMFEYDATETLPRITIPVLIISGVQDRMTKPVASEYMKAHIPNAELAIFDRSGHMGTLEKHVEITQAIHNFLKV